jgi:DNA invertase Pin-like site-specific DNA recombinase
MSHAPGARIMHHVRRFRTCFAHARAPLPARQPYPAATIPALMRCTVPVPTPRVVAILRIPTSPILSAWSKAKRDSGAGTMTIIGYTRVSTTDQDLSIQEAVLKASGCEVIRAEKRSGTTTEGREALRTVLEFLHAGDVLMVTRIDRLARSIGDLQDIVRIVRARGAALKATEQPIDTSAAAGKCFLDMLGVFAEFETNLRRERQLEGIAKAKAAGVYKGRPPSIEASRVRELKAEGMRAPDRHRQGAQDRPGVGLSGCWGLLADSGLLATPKQKKESARCQLLFGRGTMLNT